MVMRIEMRNLQVGTSLSAAFLTLSSFFTHMLCLAIACTFFACSAAASCVPVRLSSGYDKVVDLPRRLVSPSQLVAQAAMRYTRLPSNGEPRGSKGAREMGSEDRIG
uniref:Uncharacterized protein n=1 Tax=Guillardia theta TaxID=55529 RepID=A0A7S4P1C8_GUITH